MKSMPSGKLAVAVPDHRRLAAGHLLQRNGEVAVAVGSGKDDDRALHAISIRSIRKFSITVLASSLRHISSISCIARAVGEVELDQLAGADVVDARKAEAFERMVDRLALRVEDAGS